MLDNEVLTVEQYAGLLDEIRACLAVQPNATGPAFRRLAQGLSAPALGLLLLLGGVATVSCEGAPLHRPGTLDAALADTRPSHPDGPPEASPDRTPDNTLHIVLPEVALAKADAPADLATYQADVKSAPSTGPDGAKVTLQEIMDSCACRAAHSRPCWTVSRDCVIRGPRG